MLIIGVDVDTATEDGTTPLMYSCMTSQLHVCRWLVEVANCEINKLNKFGCNASQWCALNGSVPLVKYMTKMGLDVGILNKNGHSVLHKVCISNTTKFIILIYNRESNKFFFLSM